MKKVGLLFLLLSVFVLGLAGCAFLCNIGVESACDEVEPTNTQGPPIVQPNTPTPPQATPTPPVGWGFVAGHAEVMVSGLPDEPGQEKEVIFCLGNPDNTNWVNIRYRTGGKYQLKGGLEPDTYCGAEWIIFDAKPAGNGVWDVTWDVEGRVTVVSPLGGTESIFIEGGDYSFRSVYRGSCGGYIPWSSEADISIISLSGDVGFATECSL